ncbi:glycosyltransferase family 4 protein [Kitasatospora paracochleata]|uniref:Glycosyltransferase involved in cell wall biosynthesis n=1 Tax=Kitasatospora paracochleata TaxID=58354 RepID=A0ABT1J472_9ACTN|nr:glycosyltransferase family 4 protein [Kitasatospora paracochleata]MCP2312230.1 glycosyltransferase involved in cell wall biosynthesis [Kitasatospora paracochleata]
MPEPRLRGPGGRPLRVAHLTTVDMSLHLLLATELKVDLEAGFETYGISAPGPYVDRLQAIGVRHEPLPSLTRSWHPRADLAAGRELLAALRRIRPDVLHTHNPKTGVLGRVLGRLAGVPVVVNTCHGLWAQAHDPLARRAFVLGAEAFAGRFSHAELYQNAEDRAALARAVPAFRSRVVGNGVDLTRFETGPAVRARLRAELGVADDELLVGGVGRRVAEKGIREYAEAARALAGKARFVWIGPDDPDKSDALREAEQGVAFLGSRDDMPAVYAALDLFVLPSYREGFSRSAMEAAACGLPMVLSDIRGCREIGTHGEHLLLTPPGDARALTAALDRLLTEPGLRAELGTAARRRALDRFDQRAVARVSLQTYAAVARARGLPWTVG